MSRSAKSTELLRLFAPNLAEQEAAAQAELDRYRCNFDEMVSTVMAYNAGKVPTPGPHTCGLDSRHQPAGS